MMQSLLQYARSVRARYQSLHVIRGRISFTRTSPGTSVHFLFLTICLGLSANRNAACLLKKEFCFWLSFFLEDRPNSGPFSNLWSDVPTGELKYVS